MAVIANEIKLQKLPKASGEAASVGGAGCGGGALDEFWVTKSGKELSPDERWLRHVILQTPHSRTLAIANLRDRAFMRGRQLPAKTFPHESWLACCRHAETLGWAKLCHVRTRYSPQGEAQEGQAKKNQRGEGGGKAAVQMEKIAFVDMSKVAKDLVEDYFLSAAAFPF